ncbi:molybdopterin converting factor, subunit 2 [Dictyocaulus viviparus]|uniref:Molybdopterin converting factor, subunit 2 n=1 Tax=Dictyocaulus viviparus TaxID=29172 RepID=A0A0D8XEA7_DICVI|nr:molybdopterin converting factor, subunit 2 [Dictyocaulus viviparus]
MFNGRVVTRLDYESYDEMAHKELRKLCSYIRGEYPSIERIVIMHRVGEVAVGEISVIVATAAPHRGDALHATERAINQLKAIVPIWKKELRKLCSYIRGEYPSIERIVIMHRVGEVAVGEISVIVATAAPHRGDALHATERAIDHLKATVPIWKKEMYEDGGCSWKENNECCVDARPDVSVGENFARSNRTGDENLRVFWLRRMIKQMNNRKSL